MRELITNKVPVLFVGPPGVGKTAIISDSFDHAEIVLASTMVEEDISGLPYREGDYDYRTIPAIFRRINEANSAGKSTVLFFDELDKARRSVADTLLTLIASRGIGNARLPEKTCIAAAANPPEFGGGDGISDAMISRFSVVKYVPSPSKWANWAMKRFKDGKCINIINKIRNGEIQIIDMAGEGLERRISSPRTLTLALDYLESQGSVHFESIARGLLTANVASLVIAATNEEVDETIEKSVSVKMKSDKKFRPMWF